MQQVLGGDNKLALQYGRGGGTGFGTLARFYYPDFSVRHDPSESAFPAPSTCSPFSPRALAGAQVAGVFQRDDLGNRGQKTDWYPRGARVASRSPGTPSCSARPAYDHVKKNNGSEPQYLAKFTGAVAITADRGFLSRPELRLFYTWAVWNEAARTAGVDSGRIYTTPTC